MMFFLTSIELWQMIVFDRHFFHLLPLFGFRANEEHLFTLLHCFRSFEYFLVILMILLMFQCLAICNPLAMVWRGPRNSGHLPDVIFCTKSFASGSHCNKIVFLLLCHSSGALIMIQRPWPWFTIFCSKRIRTEMFNKSCLNPIYNNKLLLNEPKKAQHSK